MKEIILTCFFVFFSLALVKSQDKVDSLHVKGNTYNFLIDIPKGDSSYPLIINLHGWSMNAGLQRTLTQMTSLARKNKAIVLYPEAPDKSFAWNPEEDIYFIRSVIPYMIKNFKIDSNRIYVVGFSSGGFFAHYLANKMADQLAAVAAVEGGVRPEWELAQPPTPVPIMIIHNKFDLRTKYLEYAIPACEQWVKWNGCDTIPRTSIHSFDPFVSLKSYSGRNGGCKVLFYSFDLKMGNGHMWPYKNMCGMDAARLIEEFFMRHTKKQQVFKHR